MAKKTKTRTTSSEFNGAPIQFTVERARSLSGVLQDGYVVRMRLEGKPPNSGVTLDETHSMGWQDCLQNFANKLNTLLEGAWRIE